MQQCLSVVAGAYQRMYSRLRGIVEEIQSNTVTLDVSGVGFEVHCSHACVHALAIGVESRLLVYTDVKQDSIRLFGFIDALEKQLFLLLLEVQGIGPRTAMEVLSAVEPRMLLRAIGEGDVHQLRAVKGVGKKTAERIVVELKDKVAGRVEAAVGEGLVNQIQVESRLSTAAQEACQALESLGFPRKDAEAALKKVPQAEKLNASQMVKEALRFV